MVARDRRCGAAVAAGKIFRAKILVPPREEDEAAEIIERIIVMITVGTSYARIALL